MIHLLRRLFLLQSLYSIKSKFALLVDYGLVGLILYLLISGVAIDYRIGAVLVGLYSYMLMREFLKHYIVHVRLRKQKSLEPVQLADARFMLTAAMYQYKESFESRPLRRFEGGQIYDTVFDYYRKTKSGRYKSKQFFYTMYEGTLMRPVPHILFDNKRAKGQQFKYLFLRKQRLSLEGDFDRYFATYAPDHYQIDTLSFITPEVMETLKTADKWDVELVGDRVFIYAPLIDLTDLPVLEATGRRIQAAINDNLDNYADSYVVGPERRTITHPYARQLLKSPMKPLIMLGIGVVLFGVLLYWAFTESTTFLLSEPAIYLYVFIGVYAYRVGKIIYDNKRLERHFEKTKQYQAIATQANPYR